MKLSQLKKDLPKSKTTHFREREIKGIQHDSRCVSPGDLFVAISGENQDGHPFAVEACSNGAAAVIVERKLALPKDITQIIVPDSREALALLSARLKGFPSELMTLVGITGTNGKTTTAWMVKDIFNISGRPSGMLGTISYHVGKRCLPAANTTPSSLHINEMLAEMMVEGQNHAVMEVSSHALTQKRVHGIDFDAAVFTNITNNEHLDYHKTFGEYRKAKAMLFEMLEPSSHAILNIEDPSSGYMVQHTRANVITYGVACTADVRAIVSEMSMSGTVFDLMTPWGTATVRGKFFGQYNVSNATAAAAAALSQGVELDSVVQGLEAYKGTPGRLETINCGQNFGVLVDYAHTADALDNVLSTLRQVAPARLIVAFGCGGERDRGKRPKMGAIARELADYIVLTADNSRSERTEDIINEIMAGVGECDFCRAEPDRTEAIRLAVEEAEPGDIVLIAGKGHETIQVCENTKRPYDDRVEARAALQKLISRTRKTVA